MKCFTPNCPHPALYTFHSGGLCIVHAAETRQNAPTVLLTAIDDEPTDPNPDHHPTLEVGSVYPRDRPGE